MPILVSRFVPNTLNAVPPDADDMPVTPAGDMSSTNVQSALEELDAEINQMADMSLWFQNQLL
jgi:hypothetical protein